MAYAIRLPDGTLVQNIPDEVTPQEAKRRILAAGLYKPPTPETTVLGEAKELFKGLVPGAVGLIESAATGASALLSEQTEKAAREKIASIAGTAKAPFAAAPGYEEAVGRKLGEAIGSTAPFLAAGPLGLAGKVGAVGLGVGAGAGEARVRAEKEGATTEQRSTATALGVIPGAMEVFAPFRILSRIPESAKAQGVQLVKRALVAGGEEAAQEAASGFAQNLIAKGVYKPEQELIEGLGEQAAYGGATGAIVQGLMDLALGRRARAARTAPEESPIERAEREATAKAAAAPPAPPAEEPTPPAVEAPAPPVEEPVVRKSGEPPAGGMQPAEIEALGIAKRQPIYRRLLGKDMNDPAQRDAVLADIEKYLTRGNGSEESRAKLTEFKERFAPPAAETPTPPAAEAAPPAPTETTSATGTVEPSSGAGVAVAGEPGAGAAPGGVGVTEPTGVVPSVADVGEPAAGEGAEPGAVAAAPAPKPTPVTPEYTEEDIDRAVNTGLLTEEQAEVYRAELRAEEAPPTVMGAAFQKQIDGIRAQMDALRQKNGKPPAKKSPARAKYDELQAQLDALAPKEEGDLAARLEKMGASGVVGSIGARPTIDLAAVRENLTKARAAPKMYEAMLNYIGVDKDGDYLPTTYSSDEAAELVGLNRSSGANVRRAAEAMGITADVISRFHAGQTDKVGIDKNVSESGTGLTDVQPKRGVLYEAPKKNQPGKAAGFLRGALTSDGKLDFTGLDNKQIAEIYARASNYDPKRGGNLEVIKKLNAEIAARTKADRKGMQSALDRAYRVVRAEEETAAEQTETDRVAEEGVEAEEVETEDKTRRLSDEDIEYRTIPQSPVVTNRASHTELEKVVTDIGKMLGGKVDVTILDDVTDVDAKQKPGSRAGATIKGGIYLFRSGIAKGLEGQKTVFHELFHKGLKSLLPEAEYRATMNRFYSQSADIRAMADAYLASDAGKQDTKNLSPQDARVLAVKESLAEVAEQTDLNPTLVRQVGGFLARVADRLGMPQLARAIRTMGLNEQEKFIRDALQAGLGSTTGEGATRFRTTITPEAEATAKELDAIGERKQRGVVQKIGKQLEGRVPLRIREKLVDSLAPMEDWFVNAYGGQIRTASGRLNPMVLLSRALDALRISKAAQIEGGLSREDGLIVATELKDADGRFVSYSGVLNRIADAAKAEGKTYEDYRNTIDNILYGHREFYLRQKNREIEQQAQALDDAGKADKAKTLREGIVELYLTDEQIDRAETAFQQDDFIKGVLSDLDTVRFNMLDMLVETSRISKEQAQDYKDNLGYIPFERIGEYENQWTQATRGANRGVAALRKLRQLEGSKRKSTSVVENFSGFMDWATKEAMKNEAARRALGDMELLGAAQRREQPPATDSPGGMVDVYEDGQKVRFYVPDPAHLVTFSLADPQLSNIIKGLSQATRLLRAGVTSMPPFAIKQIFDDVVRAYTYAGVKDNKTLVKNVLSNFLKLWPSELRNQKTSGIRELENLGIVGTYDITQHTNLKDILKESGAEKEGLGSAILRVMEAGAKASDLAVRKAIYDQVLTETGDTAQAESAAREIINFSRRGSSRMMNMMISVIPFFNAYAQGMDKLASAAAGGLVGKKTGTARSMFYKRMMVLTAMGTAYALLMSDDEEYEKLPDHVRDTNWVLPYGKALGFTPAIPIPAELAFFFKAIPERVLRYYKYQGTEDERAAIDVLKELTKRGVDVFSSPNLMAQGIRPLVENLINYSFFLGRPLESQSQLALRPFERYGTGTSESMKAVGSLLEDAANATGMETFAISPIKLENALRGLFGTSMGLALSVSDALLYPNRTDRPLHQQIGSQITGVSAVMKDPVGTRFMDEIYDLEKRTAQVYGTYNRMLKTKPEEAEAFLLDNIGMYSIRPQVQSLMETIRVMNESTQAINRDTSLSPEERRKLIDDLRAEQNDIARQVWQLRREARSIQLGLAAPSS